VLPLRDNIRSYRFPLVNYMLIAVTSAAFLLQLLEGRKGDMQLVERYGMIPARVFHPERPIVLKEIEVRGPFRVPRLWRAAEPPVTPWLTLLTCIFLHGGWVHFLSNMWFLYIFGDNVEDRFGHLGYLVFYAGAGAAASATHLVTSASSEVPTIGASGAIAGVMGAYFLLFPRAMVVTLVPLFVFVDIVVLPASFFLGIWFVLQFFQGTLAITSSQAGGVAWWAHIGGFAAGVAVVFLLRQAGRLPHRSVHMLPRTQGVRRISHYGPRWP
jgi:hypothetical protein